MVALVLFVLGATAVSAALGALFGPAVGLLVAGVFCLYGAWDMTRPARVYTAPVDSEQQLPRSAMPKIPPALLAKAPTEAA